jgi:hypothetical protein
MMKRNWNAKGTRQAALPPTNLYLVRRYAIRSEFVSDVRESVCDPITERKASNVHDHLDHNQFAAPARLGSFALPDRSSRSVDTVPDACNDSAHNHLGYTERGNLEYSPNAHNGRAKQNTVLSTQRLPNSNHGDCAEEAADVIDGGNS